MQQPLQTVRPKFIPAGHARPCLLIVDTHRFCRDNLVAAVTGSSSSATFRLRTADDDVPTILSQLRDEIAPVVLLSCCDASLRPLSLLAEIRSKVPGARIVALTHPDTPGSDQAAHLQADALIQSTRDIATVVQAIAASAPIARVEPLRRLRPLTPREAQIVSHLAAGLRNAQIAEAIGIAEKTVKVNLTNIYGKLGIRSRAELAALAPRLLTVSRGPRRVAV
jgi:DNA-binding NarL/FixJ family response regulator